MKKLKFALFSALVLGLTAVSCGDDDSSSATSGKLEGKWIYSQEKEGNEPLTDFPHTEGCDKDYMEITAQSIKDVWFYNDGDGCQEDSDTSVYVRTGNKLTVTEGTEVYTGTIEKLTSTDLTISSTETEEDGTTVKYTSTYKRG